LSFTEIIDSHLRGEPKKSLAREMHKTREVETSNDALRGLIQRGRASLRQHGVQKGDRVVLVAPNSAKWIAADLAILSEGAVVVPLYVRQEPKELVDIIADADVKLVVCEDRAIAESIAGPQAPFTTFEEFFGAAPADAPVVVIEQNDPVTIIYTSGTSGRAKGVVLNRANVEFMLDVTDDALLDLTGRAPGLDRVFHYLPFCFAGSRIMLWTLLFRNNPIWMSTNLDDLKEEFVSAQPHFFLNVPALLERIKAGVETKLQERGKLVWGLYQRAFDAVMRKASGDGRLSDLAWVALAERVIFKKIREGLGPNLQCLICGSALLGEETQRFFEMLGIPVYQIYGLTETTGIVTMDKPNRARAGYVGLVIQGVETRIGEGSELEVRGPNVFGGYFRNEQATKDAMTGDGWFRTGDAVEMENGYLKIVGRTKNILVPTSGHNVAPEPIEERLRETIPGAAHVVVFGHGRPFLTAVVSGKDIDPITVRTRIEELNGTLPHYRRIRAHRVTSEAFTPESGLLTANQKLRRSAIEKHLKSEIDQMYA
jgi:long-chain acyl-CoA synthetase